MKTQKWFFLLALPLSALAEPRLGVQDGVTLELTQNLSSPSGIYELKNFLGDRHCTLQAYSGSAISLPAGTKLKGQLFISDRVLSTNSFTLERQALTGLQFFTESSGPAIVANCESHGGIGNPTREVPTYAEFLRRAVGTFRIVP